MHGPWEGAPTGAASLSRDFWARREAGTVLLLSATDREAGLLRGTAMHAASRQVGDRLVLAGRASLPPPGRDARGCCGPRQGPFFDGGWSCQGHGPQTRPF